MECQFPFIPWDRRMRALFIIFLLCTPVLTKEPCPRDCFCPRHNTIVQCANKNFHSIPDNIAPGTTELNLNENPFKNSALTRRNFTGLQNIQKLFLSDCDIETIAVGTFSDLTNLTWLDLTNNRIKYIADFTFKGLQLKHLLLSGNVGVQFSIGAFSGLTTQGLYMRNCGLRRLPVDLMIPLNGSLKTLWIQENSFESFGYKWKYFFKNLAHVQLGGNSFHCNCEIQWLYVFFNEYKNSLFDGGDEPKCGSPSIVKSKTFDQLTKDDFRCELPTFQNVEAIFDSKTGKLTCQAKGDPAPVLHWVSPNGSTETFYPRSLDIDSQTNAGVLHMTDIKLENKDLYKCVASNPAGNVTFTLNVVWPDLRPTTPKPTQSNVIVADTTSNAARRAYNKNYAGDDSGVYDWAGVNPESSKMKPSDRDSGSGSSSSHLFSIVDIIGAIVGTFILTLLITVTAFHFYYKRKERIRNEDHYSVPDEIHNGRRPNSVYIMNEAAENRMKMINHHNTECPS